ncbi:MAG: PAS domain S-box protein, partial [Anaerolineae bacterium]|nr:PAS domain S-box protein [Anaerolineae bacterium]
KAGEIRDVLMSAELIELASVQCLLTMAQDVTVRKETETALRESEAFSRAIIACSPIALYSIDLEGNVLSWNASTERIFGWTADEVIGRPLPIIPADKKDEFDVLRARLLDGQDFFDKELVRQRKDGSLFDVRLSTAPIYDADGNIIGIMAALEDIAAEKRREAEILATQAELQRLLAEAEQTRLALISVVEDQKRTEEALAAERTLLRTLVDHLPDAIYTKDAAGCKTLANPTDVRNIGAASEAEVLGKTDFELFPRELAERYHADDLHVLQTGQPILNREERITRPDGKLGWQLTSKAPLHDSAGKVVGLVGIGYDITERKQIEQKLQDYAERLEELVAERTRALEEAQERLLHQTRLATLGQIAGSIAHELRTPLGAIRNAVYLINMLRGSSDETLEEAIDILNQEVATSDRVITSLLNFARPQRPQRHLLEVGPLVECMVQRLQPPPTVQLEIHVDGDLSPVIADATHLEQMFGNLLLNAIQAMPEGGQLSVRAEQRAALPEIAPPGFIPEHAADANAGWIVVSIGDTGIGIPPENLEHVFEPLFTTKATGIGLGLALVKLLIQANGGGIAVTSVPGEGTTFGIYLPVAGMSDENINAKTPRR